MTDMVFLLSASEQRELFGDAVPPSYEQEAAERWGDSPYWTQAANRVSDYAIMEWREVRDEQQDWERELVRLMSSGEPADGGAATDHAEAQRLSIERWFHDCPVRHHVALTEALLSDASFRTRYEGLASGAAEYLRAAVHANAARRTKVDVND